ncbi:MAG: sensor histidine kinase [Aquabacterium sp.]|jgi:signal transduction histidine kinase|uniref:sensor histidine kinase n=1 Tax=Aquabacterium sp. TaxID=1872578 RepID=UPI001B51E7D9|nr:sensor histidine kinase [Aquabacterium sp.]MBP7131863.1 sensor histidine kinase [Aquabacterium sp.]MBP9062977.1 sensor histidine kinase [Aquabacterium sp.]MDQ5925137.1 hypothetical protein [Pseudomonadota bacterium]
MSREASRSIGLPYLRSLRHRLLLITLIAAAVTLTASWFILSGLFRDHVRQQHVERLSADLDQVIARLEVDAQGRPTLDDTRLSDPRWQRPNSGLYWQVDGAGAEGKIGMLRSRSLWDEQLLAPRDRPANGELHVHTVQSPGKEPLLLIERTLHVQGAQPTWRIMVAAELRPLELAAQRFDSVLAWSLLAVLTLLALGALLQVAVGLAPLNHLRQALSALREGRTQRLEGSYPEEIQPLVDDLNSVLDRNTEVVQRARAQAGNLAHALKTPLTLLSQGARAAQDATDALTELPTLVTDQVLKARRHIDWHLARSRAAAAQDVPGLRTPVKPIAEGLVRVMHKVHAQPPLTMVVNVAEPLAFAGEAEDLQEMLGNLLDNACKSARTQVLLKATQNDKLLCITVDDDGPGIPEARVNDALRRGGRLDESTPGSGLGLAIVQEVASLYGGTLKLGQNAAGGLQAVLTLPA